MAMTLEALCRVMEIATRPVGVYDAPDPAAFAPLVPLQRCIFEHYGDWQEGRTIDVTARLEGCRGGHYWLTGVESFPSRELFVDFLANKEGLNADPAALAAWLDASPPYRPEHGHVLIGPVRDELAPYLRTVTFFVDPDRLSVLMLGAVHHAHPADPEPVIAPFGSGCGQLLAMFPDLKEARALIGATDIAMRGSLPPELLAFTVTVPMLERLLSLDPEHSFLGKPFLKHLRRARRR
jgi:hypothetical protein